MPLSAWLMLVFGSLIVYGGLGVCLLIAFKGGRNDSGEGDEG